MGLIRDLISLFSPQRKLFPRTICHLAYGGSDFRGFHGVTNSRKYDSYCLICEGNIPKEEKALHATYFFEWTCDNGSGIYLPVCIHLECAEVSSERR